MMTNLRFDEWGKAIERERIALEKMRATWKAGPNIARICWAFAPVVQFLAYRSGHY